MQFYDKPLINTPCTIQLVGAIGTGKTSFSAGLIIHKDDVFTTPPEHVYYHFNVWSNTFDMFSHLDYVSMSQNLPTKNEIENFKPNSLIFLDDLSISAYQSKDVLELVMVRCRHKQCTVVIISHNLFTKGIYSKSIQLNTSIYVLFASKVDQNQISLLGKRCFPNKQNEFLRSYQDAVNLKNYSYLLVDLSLPTNDLFRLRSQIFPSDEVLIVYKL